jgi:Asp/Glu/hydantoin racemase
MKIAAIHATINAVKPLMDRFAAATKESTLLNFVDEHLLERVNRTGKVDEAALRAFARLVFSAVEAQPDGILVACSVYFPYIPLIKSFVPMPIIAIDAPMLETAVTNARKIGLVATTAATAPATQKRLVQLAAEKGKQVEIHSEVIPQAMILLSAGDTKGHNTLAVQAAERLVRKGCDTIILCQISTACAATDMGHLSATILNSIDPGIQQILRLAAGA